MTLRPLRAFQDEVDVSLASVLQPCSVERLASLRASCAALAGSQSKGKANSAFKEPALLHMCKVSHPKIKQCHFLARICFTYVQASTHAHKGGCSGRRDPSKTHNPTRPQQGSPLSLLTNKSYFKFLACFFRFRSKAKEARNLIQ